MKENNHRRILRIGNKLVEGPSAIFRVSDGDWLEKDLQIILYEPGMKKIASYSIWSDDSMNKESNFMPPMIRILTWNRREDLANLKEDIHRTFPIIDLKLGSIKKEKFKELNNSFINFQKSLLKNHSYIPYKIATKRDSAETEVDYDQPYLDFSIYIRNGKQALEFSSSGNMDNILINDLLAMKRLLSESIKIVDLSNWKERYYELTEAYLEGVIPEWYYENEIKTEYEMQKKGL